MRVINRKYRVGRKQRGLIVILFTISLLILLGFAALAIDINHMILNKSRVQNGVDSASLAASVALKEGATATQAATAAIDTIKEMASAAGNDELDLNVSTSSSSQNEFVYTSSNGTTVKVQFNKNPISFPTSSTLDYTQDIYARVAVEGHALESYLVQIFGISKSVRASAVSGPSPGITGTARIAPIGICDKSTSGTGPIFGYETGVEIEIAGKTSGNSKNECKPKDGCSDNNSGDIGPGNYNFLQMEGYGQGKSADGLRAGLGGNPPTEEFTGDETGIYFVGDDIETETGSGGGDNNGPASAINSRFVDTDGYPPADDDPGPNLMSSYNGDGRRQVVLPIVDCSGGVTGNDEVKIEGFACVLLTRQYTDKKVYGEFYEGCTVPNGTVDQNNPTASGPFIIQLYRDLSTGDS